ncbi:MAG: hypothetical protein ACKVP6_09085 [Mycobacterium sp.]
MSRPLINDERGIALVMTMLLAFAVAAMAVGAIMLSSNATLTSRFFAKEVEMEAAADMGLEQARDSLNGSGILLPQTGFDTLSLNAPVLDAAGSVIPGFTRSVYAGRTGTTTGQFGVFASVLSVIQDARGAVVIRRAELNQESFAKFARFDDQTTSSVRFANGIQVFGPLHTNGTLYVGPNTSTAPTFWGPVTTAATISTTANGTFRQGFKENQAVIPMPTPASLASLSTYAALGNTTITGGAVGTTVFDPSTRIEFVPVDINLDGDFTDANEGFMMVSQATGATPTAAQRAYVSARRWNTASASDPNAQSPNCGSGAAGAWVSAQATNPTGAALAAAQTLLNAATRQCYLGGDPRMNPGGTFVAATPITGTLGTLGSWLLWPGYGGGAAPGAIAAGRLPNGTLVGATQATYMWPVTRSMFNVNFKGVIYVNGSVAVSGQLRGQVTVAASGNIMLADDVTYVTAPGSSIDCSADIFGLLTPQFFMLEDNNVNAPFRVNNIFRTGYDDSANESLHAAVLTLNSIQTENVTTGSTNSEVCVGSPIGRGCFNMTGAAIQGINGSRMASSGTGWNPQWTYDRCDGINPPPYFPTTGHYVKNRYYEIDPVGFDVVAWFAANSA